MWSVSPPQTGYSNVDGSPTKTKVLKSRKSTETKYLWELAFAKRSEEETYNLKNDSYSVINLIDSADYVEMAFELRKEMERALIIKEDPRMFGKGDVFQDYESSNLKNKDAYNRIVVKKEKLVPAWINASDIETDFIE